MNLIYIASFCFRQKNRTTLTITIKELISIVTLITLIEFVVIEK